MKNIKNAMIQGNARVSHLVQLRARRFFRPVGLPRRLRWRVRARSGGKWADPAKLSLELGSRWRRLSSRRWLRAAGASPHLTRRALASWSNTDAVGSCRQVSIYMIGCLAHRKINFDQAKVFKIQHPNFL